MENKDKINMMIDVFMTARSVYRTEIKEVLYMAAIDMLYEKHKGIGFNISLIAGSLLGKSAEESSAIALHTTELYDARSNYIHNGNAEEAKSKMSEASEISRRVIMEIINISHDKNKKLRNILKDINRNSQSFISLFTNALKLKNKK